MENQDAEFIGIFVAAVLLLVYAMVLNWIDDRKKRRLRERKNKRRLKRRLKE